MSSYYLVKKKLTSKFYVIIDTTNYYQELGVLHYYLHRQFWCNLLKLQII